MNDDFAIRCLYFLFFLYGIQLTAEKQKDVIEVVSTPKTETDELGVGAPSENVEAKPIPVTMTQIVKLIADIHSLNNKVNFHVNYGKRPSFKYEHRFYIFVFIK